MNNHKSKRMTTTMKREHIGLLAILIAVAALALGPVGAARADSFNVSNEAELSAAISTANGNGVADTITLSADITLTSALPAITSEITIEGNNHRIERSGSAGTFRIFTVSSGGNLTLNNMTIRNGSAGSADYGGGVRNEGTVVIHNSTLSGNAAFAGGGIYNAGTLTVQNSTINGNSATSGGAIHNNGGLVTITNSTLAYNTSTSGPGGGIYNEGSGTVAINNGTLSNNSAGTYGGGVRNFSGTFTIKNTILANNTASNGPDCSTVTALTSQGNNLIENVSGCTIGGDTTGNITGLDPQLDTLRNNGGPTQTMALLPGSPAMEAGNNATCESTDQRGRTRPFDGDGNGTATCDIGAFEYTISSTIGNFVWLDANLNGLQDSDESGVRDVTVRLLDSTGTTVLETTVTDNSGNYSFNVTSGTYIVEFVRPAGMVFTLRNQGSDDTLDSDAGRSTGRSPQVTVSGGVGNDTVDAGLAIAGLTLSESGGSTVVTEGSLTDTYTVVLTAPPVSGETVTITPSFNSAQINITPASANFTESNWNTPQTFTVSALYDGITEGEHYETITHTATSSLGSGSPFHGLPVPNVEVTINDAAFGPPPLLAPADGSTVNTPTPVFQWAYDGVSTDYRLTLTEQWSGTDILKKWYTAASICTGGTCQVDLAAEGITLKHGKTYTWWVKGKYGTEIADSAVWSFTTYLIPADFSLLSPADASIVHDVSPVLQWQESARAETYKLLLKDSAGNTILSKSYNALGVCSGGTCQVDLDSEGIALKHGKTYNWKVTAKNSFGEVVSAKWTFTTEFTPAAFNLISPPDASTVNDPAPAFIWEAAERADSYKLLLKDSAGNTILSKSYNALGVCSGGTCQVDLDNEGITLKHGKTYNWKVTAKNTFGEVVSAKWTFTTDLIPAAFNLLSPGNGATIPTKYPIFQWEESARAETYKLVLKDSAGVVILKKSYNTGICASGVCQVSLLDEGIKLKNGTTYYWKVVAKNPYGKFKAGKWSFTVVIP